MNKLKSFPFHTLSSSIAKDKELLNQWLSKYKPNSMILAHIIAYIATKTEFTYVDSKIDSKSYIRDNFVHDDWHAGLYRFLMVEPRGLIVTGTQYTSEYRSYSALVPLIMSAHKVMNDIPYSSWSKDGLRVIVNPQLADAMLDTPETSFSKEELISFRNEGLVILTGNKQGEMRSPKTTHKLYGLSDPYFRTFSPLAQVMLTQIWVAHPDNRTNLMVLDPNDWDVMPEPLETSEVFKPKEPEQTSEPTDFWDEVFRQVHLR